ncbi:MAG: tetratricopeptide repeat protein, partial [Bacteroidetes bacterium]|nr:tetratricopeptide repeat protein [Bacteroidota bacterium]
KYTSATLANIGDVFLKQKDYKKAKEYYFKALKIDEETNNNKGIAVINGNIGIAYEEQKDYNNAMKFMFNSLNISEYLLNKAINNKNSDEIIENKREVSIKLGNIGNLYASELENKKFNNNEQKELFNKARYYLLKGLKIDYELNRKYGIATKLGNMGILHLNTKEYATAEDYFKKAILYSDSIDALDLMVEWNKYLSRVYEETNQMNKSLKHYKKHIELRDSINNADKYKKIIQIELNYQFDKKMALEKAGQEKKDAIEQAEIRKKNLTLLFVIAILFLVLVFTFYVIKQKNIIKKEKRRSDGLLLNILPHETAEELKHFGKSVPKKFNLVTVLFTDFKGFTMISEKMSPEFLVNELNFIFSEFDKIISKYPIEKIKTIGDSYMCAGGLPTANKTNPIDIVLAALEIKKFINNRVVTENTNIPQWKIRIGVHTGPVVAGVVGTKKFAYDIWGDTVNIASRMESSGEPDKVNISNSTFELIKNKLENNNIIATYRGEIEAKNKGKIKMYFVDNI